jgi:primosomal protein N'
MTKGPYWLENEILAVKRAFKMDQKYDKDMVIMIKFMIFAFSLLIAGYCHGNETLCPHCDKPLEIIAKDRPGYWQCKRCGYWNLDGIWKCPCCGTNKGEK